MATEEEWKEFLGASVLDVCLELVYNRLQKEISSIKVSLLYQTLLSLAPLACSRHGNLTALDE